MEAAGYWHRVYAEKQPDEVSWYQATPETSLALIREAAVAFDAPIIDVGGGASTLAGCLVAEGYTDVTVADVSSLALERARAEFGPGADQVCWIPADVRSHDFGRLFELWHDRAMLHFMVDASDLDGYLNVLRQTLGPSGHAVFQTFGPDGPSRCSGLPVTRYSPERLAGVLGPAFELVSSGTVEHRTPSGRTQQFAYAHFLRHA
jgi:hypothetical protein